MENIEKLANLGGTVITVVLFLYYLNKKDIILDKKDEAMNKIIGNHLQHSGKIIKDNSKALNKVFIALERLSSVVGKNTKSQDVINREVK